MVEMKKIIILTIILIFLVSCTEQKTECETDSDCDFLYTAYTEENPCASCYLGDENWICTTSEKAIEEMERMTNEGKVAQCTPCPDPAPQRFFCECVDSECEKIEE